MLSRSSGLSRVRADAAVDVLGVPLSVPRAAAMPWPAIVRRAVGGSEAVVVIDAFAGASDRSPVLALGREGTLDVSATGLVHLRSEAVS